MTFLKCKRHQWQVWSTSRQRFPLANGSPGPTFRTVEHRRCITCDARDARWQPIPKTP